jgi:hypothetical protein
MVNDDMPFLEITSSGVFAYGSPWCGKHGLAANVCVPLVGICSIRRGSENLIYRVDGKYLRDLLSQQVHIPDDPSLEQQTNSLVETLTGMVPLWVMHCNKELEAAHVAYSAMCCDHI